MNKHITKCHLLLWSFTDWHFRAAHFPPEDFFFFTALSREKTFYGIRVGTWQVLVEYFFACIFITFLSPANYSDESPQMDPTAYDDFANVLSTATPNKNNYKSTLLCCHSICFIWQSMNNRLKQFLKTLPLECSSVLKAVPIHRCTDVENTHTHLHTHTTHKPPQAVGLRLHFRGESKPPWRGTVLGTPKIFSCVPAWL